MARGQMRGRCIKKEASRGNLERFFARTGENGFLFDGPFSPVQG
jgi:hypothetical protein